MCMDLLNAPSKGPKEPRRLDRNNRLRSGEPRSKSMCMLFLVGVGPFCSVLLGTVQWHWPQFVLRPPTSKWEYVCAPCIQFILGRHRQRATRACVARRRRRENCEQVAALRHMIERAHSHAKSARHNARPSLHLLKGDWLQCRCLWLVLMLPLLMCSSVAQRVDGSVRSALCLHFCFNATVVLTYFISSYRAPYLIDVAQCFVPWFLLSKLPVFSTEGDQYAFPRVHFPASAGVFKMAKTPLFQIER